MVRNKRFFYVVLSLLMACFLLSGCAARGLQTGDIKEDFLTVYGTYDYERRYEIFQKDCEAFQKYAENAATADTYFKKLQAALDEYYTSVRDYVSEDFYEKMLANRAIYKYEKYAYENGYSYRPDGFEFAEYAKNGDKNHVQFRCAPDSHRR